MIRTMKVKLGVCQFKVLFQLIHPARYPMPYHYQDRQVSHLRKLKAMIEDIILVKPTNCDDNKNIKIIIIVFRFKAAFGIHQMEVAILYSKLILQIGFPRYCSNSPAR